MTQYFTEIIKKYSATFFKYALEKNILEAVHADCLKIIDLYNFAEEEIKKIVSPVYSESEQSSICESIFSEIKCSKETINFIMLVIKNKRLKDLFDIFRSFDHLYKAHIGVKEVKVISSYDLPKTEEEELEKKLEQIFSSKINLILEKNSDIMGGLIIKCDNKMYDGSLKTIFENLANSVAQEIVLL